MARPTPELIDALRTTAKRLRTDVQYYWSHQGSCNCGHLAQTITKLSKVEIHSIAIERHGDWDDHAEDYCPTSGHHLDSIITQMLEIGLERSDIGDLERLSNTAILLRIPPELRALQYNRREDVVLYMETWAAMLEEQLLATISLPLTEQFFNSQTATEQAPTDSASEREYHALELAV
ncbi:MAG: hypothetical protein MUF71_04935 [Candidatus Kapabacteria bacterium]|jgi:hypothetical protein|nr:hypothetical protein [Candidatus Kapabacteria bacterium]